MNIRPSDEHPGMYDVYFKGEYTPDATLSLKELVEFRIILNSLLDSYVFGTLHRLHSGKKASPE